MAIVDTYYQVQKPDVGRPALVAFWEAFIGTRSKINQQVMADRLAQEDPGQLAKLEGQIRDNIADLHKTRGEILKMKAQVAKETDANKVKLLTAIISAHARMEAAKTSASGTRDAARMGAESRIATTVMEQAERVRRPYDQKKVSPEVRGAMRAAAEQAGQTGSLEGKAQAYGGYIGALRAETARGSAEDLGVLRAAIDQARAVGDVPTAEWIENTYLTDRQAGETLDGYFSRKLGAPTEEQGRALAKDIVRGGVYGGSINEILTGVLPQLGFSAAEIEPYQRAAVGVEVRRAPGEVPEPGLEAAPTPQGQTAIGSMTADIDRQIKALEEEAERLRTRRAAVRPPNRFSYVMSNALLDPALVVPPREGRAAFQAMEMLSPEQRARAAELVQRAGGDPARALELLREEEQVPVPIPAEEPAAVPTERAAPEEAVLPEEVPEAPVGVEPEAPPTPAERPRIPPARAAAPAPRVMVEPEAAAPPPPAREEEPAAAPPFPGGAPPAEPAAPEVTTPTEAGIFYEAEAAGRVRERRATEEAEHRTVSDEADFLRREIARVQTEMPHGVQKTYQMDILKAQLKEKEKQLEQLEPAVGRGPMETTMLAARPEARTQAAARARIARRILAGTATDDEIDSVEFGKDWRDATMKREKLLFREIGGRKFRRPTTDLTEQELQDLAALNTEIKTQENVMHGLQKWGEAATATQEEILTEAMR